MFGADAVRCMRRGNGGGGGGTDPYWNNVSTLLHFDGDFTDSSPLQMATTAFSGAIITNTESVFGGNSGAFLNSRGVALGTAIGFSSSEDFTIEGWMYPRSGGGTYAVLAGNFGSGNVQICRVRISDGAFESVLSPYDALKAYGVPRGQWGHYAAVRHNGMMAAYYNGVLIGSKTSTTAFRINSVGATYNSSVYGTQYIDELRITKGVARYTANFTPPTEPFPEG